MHLQSKVLISTIVLSLFGCASSSPTVELLDARRAYERARTSTAARLAPDQVYEAQKALARAEAVHEDNPASREEQSYAYVAKRRAELAMVQGNFAQIANERAQAKTQYVELQGRLRNDAERDRDRAQQQVKSLENERQLRRAAEERLQKVMQTLDRIAQVKEEARGTVITMPGQVLFVTGKAELLPGAREQLAQVAKAILDSGAENKVVVEGYTDSRGSDESNLRLSQERADAVRNHLIKLGVTPEQVTAIGKGKDSPVASNDTAEGRANNRRVELIVTPNGNSGSSAQPR